MSRIDRRIVLPTDLGEGSEIVFAHGLQLALETHCQLLLVHVHPRSDEEVNWTRLPTVKELLTRWGRLSADAAIADFERLGTCVRAEDLVGPRAAEKLVAGVDWTKTDLLVVGTHQRRGLTRILRGSVAETVAREGDVPTLFVGQATRGFVDPASGQVSLKRVLLPVCRGFDPDGVLDTVIRLVEALAQDTEFVFLHMGDQASAPPGLVSKAPRPGHAVATVILPGPVVPGIVEQARALSADLIVMVTEGHDSPGDALWGSKTEKVIRQAPCPVLALPF